MATADHKIVIGLGVKDVGVKKGLEGAEQAVKDLDIAIEKLSDQFHKQAITQKEYSSAMSKLEKSKNSYAKSISNATTGVNKLSKATKANAIPATQELSRVIQDMPYGMQGVANNIQQLTSQMGYLSAKSGGFKNALKAMASSLIGPAGILMAVSLVTAAWPYLVQAFTKSETAIKDTKFAIDSLTAAYDRYLQKSKDAQTLINEATKMQIAEAKLRGANADELNKITDKGVSKRISAIGMEMQERANLIKAYNKRYNALFEKGDDDSLKLADEYGLEMDKLNRKQEESRLEIQKLGNALVLADLELALQKKEEAHQTSVDKINKINQGLFRDTPSFSGMGVGTFDNRGGSMFSGMFLGMMDDMETPEWATNVANSISDRGGEIVKATNDVATLAGQAAQVASKYMTEAFSGIGEFLGDVLSGQANNIRMDGQKVLGAFGKFLGEMGKMAIAYGTFQMAMAIAGSGPPNPVSAGIIIAAGVGMVAVGKAISNKMKQAPAASSGISSGVGGGGSSSFRGSSSSAVSSGGGGGTYVFEIEGTKLVGVLSRTLNRNKALGGSLSLA